MCAIGTPTATATGSRLSYWTFAIGAGALVTMMFNPLSVVGAAALVPGLTARRTRAPHLWLATIGMVLGVLASLLVVSYLVGGEG